MPTFVLRQWLKERKHKESPWGEKLDSNGYVKSLFDTKQKKCYLCGKYTDTARHEVFFGTADRSTSKAVGLWINVCPVCHNQLHEDSERMHRAGQRVFEYVYSHQEFIDLFGKNYLELKDVKDNR